MDSEHDWNEDIIGNRRGVASKNRGRERGKGERKTRQRENAKN